MSPAYPERVMGGLTGLLIRPDVFWKSVADGPLWQYGEWLEATHMWADPKNDPTRTIPPEVKDSLIEKARSGEDHQKYVALCLLGYFRVDAAGDLLVETARSAAQPGVAAAAWWAAGRIGRKIDPVSCQSLIYDELTGLQFVRVPGTRDFRRGSDTSDPDRFIDEDRPERGEDIEPFLLSTTEVTLAAFEEFFRKTRGSDNDVFGNEARGTNATPPTGLTGLLRECPRDAWPRIAVTFVSLKAAKAYCEWLNERERQLEPARMYRLPSETQWEWACRGGSAERFCYGHDAKYVVRFGKCDGYLNFSADRFVAACMPNFYGLFDMYGGLWEWCDSVYPLKVRENETLYVKRGGGFTNPGRLCRSAQRNYAASTIEQEYNSFRLIMELVQ
jgi:formylglycine-generating enzyme required for sulfatase activity